jgi:acetylornithine deacetylase/succinyl-diaminopimelate desuccinylase-like protein
MFTTALLALALAAGPTDYDALARDTRQLVTELVAADTTSPPGDEERAVVLGAARLKAAGLPFQTFTFAPGRQNLVARLKGEGSQKPLLLIAHTDVVGAGGQTWSSPPHTLVEKDGYLVGRGVNDDLGMAAVEMEVFLTLAREKTPLRRDVILAWTGDEESGGAGIRWMLANHRAAVDAALALNEGGGLTLGDDGKVKLASLQEAEKTYLDFSVTTQGTTGHSSVPLDDNAIYRLARALDRLSSFRFPARLLPVTRAYFEQRAQIEPAGLSAAFRALAAAKGPLPSSAVATLEADPVLASNLRTTCVATTLAGGTRVNALPAEATANVNCRILPDETPEQVQRELETVIGDRQVAVKPVSDFGPAAESALSGEGPEAVKRVVAHFWPGVPVAPFLSRGATDSRHLRAAGIPAYGMDPLPVTEAEGRRAHGVDERVPTASFRTGVEFFHALVLDLAARR